MLHLLTDAGGPSFSPTEKAATLTP
jgi:hypothetical protein